MSKAIAIQGGTIITLGDEPKVLEKQVIIIRDDCIDAIIPESQYENNELHQVIQARGKVVMPAFINAHMHFYSSFARGLIKAEPASNFIEVLNNLWWRLDKKLTISDIYYSTLVAAVSSIKHGCTTLIDHHASPYAVDGSLMEIRRALEKAQLRASLCYEISERDGDGVCEAGINENIAFIKECKAKSSEFKAHFGLHAAFTVSDKTLARVAQKASDLDVGFHLHVAEDLADENHSLKEHKSRVVERLARFGILGPKTILAHCTHVNEKELELIQMSNSMVVHNPQSNMNNAVGVAPLFAMLQKKILVGLGTDAMTTNMLQELRSALWVRRLHEKNPSIGFMECLDLLLQGNRKIAARSWTTSLGEIRPGAKADIILLDYHAPTPLDNENFLGHILFGLAESRVHTTIANGKVLMENYELTNLDEGEIMEQARFYARQLWARF